MVVKSLALPGSEIELSESPGHTLVIATEVAKALGWEIANVTANGFIAHTSGSAHWPGEMIRVHINDNTVYIDREHTDGHIIDEQVTAAYIHNFLQGIQAIKYYFTAEELELKYFQLQMLPGFDPLQPVQQVIKAEPAKPATLGTIKDYPVTAIIVALNVLLFGLMVALGADIIKPDTGMMIQWGANYGLETLHGDWWRLITSCFLHFGIVHLLMNMYALIYVGIILEPQIGSLRLLVAYMLSGLVASLTSVWWHSWVVAAGASGAVFGMYGLLLAMLTTSYIEQKIRKPMLMYIAFYVLYNLGNGMQDGIDNAAHIGGLISGMAIGYLYVYFLKRPNAKRLTYPVVIALTIFITVISGFVYSKIPNSLAIYQQQMQLFVQNETQAERSYEEAKTKPVIQALQELKDTSMMLWKKNAVIAKQISALDLPEEIEKRNKLIMMYSDLRIQSLDLTYLGLKENTQQHNGELESVNHQMEQLKVSLQQ